MSDDDALSAIVAALGRVAVDRVTSDARLGELGIGSSIALGILQSRLRETFGRAPDPLSWKTTVADLRTALAGASANTPAARPISRTAAAAPRAQSGAIVGVGLDLEDVASLPAPGDAFYADHFTPAELEAARATDDARRHLCGVWCAKEAARKAVPALLSTPLTELEVTTDGAGRPSLHVRSAAHPSVLPRLELSITHTTTAAAAVVIALT